VIQMPRLPSFTEGFMAESVQNFLEHKHVDLAKCDIIVSELSLEGCKFDVVGYAKNEKTFYVVECKKGNRARDIGHAFGQILAYQSVISNKGQEFCDKFVDKALEQGLKFDPKDIRSLFREKELPFRFFVALRDEACRSAPLLRLMKESLERVGIISVRRDGTCKDYIPTERKKRDRSICRSEPINIPVIGEPGLEAFLEKANAEESVRNIIRELVQNVEIMGTGIFKKFRKNSIAFRTTINFSRVIVRKKGIVVDIYKNGKSWLHDRGNLLRRQKTKSKWATTEMVNSREELASLTPLIKRAFRLSQR